MQLRFLALFLLAMCITACSKSNSTLNDPKSIEKERLADLVIRKTATKLKKETNMRPCGTMGQMLNEIQKLGLSFYYYQPTDIVEARKLLVKSVDAMLQEVNQETKIHPFLIRYPFMPRNIEIEIFLRNPDGKDVKPGTLYVISASDGNLVYQIDHPQTKKLTTIYKETFEEAKQRVADPSLPLVHFQPDPEISPEKLAQIHKGISFVGDDGVIWLMNEKGEWVKHPNWQKKEATKAIVEVTAKNGAKVSVSIDSLEHSIFRLNGTGFQPYETVNFISNSNNEVLHYSLTADDKGNLLPIQLSPAVIGKSGGICNIHLLRREDSIHVKLPWGRPTKIKKIDRFN